VDRIPALVVELASEQSALSALQGALTARLLVSQASATLQENTGERLLTAEEAATTLGDEALGAEEGAEASVRAADFRPRDQVLRGGSETGDVEPEALGGLNGSVP
jgi:hypothetical protein